MAEPEKAPEKRPQFSGPRLVVAAALASAGVTALLVNIMERKQEAKNPFYRVVELDDIITDPAVWGKNFPLQYDGYKRTVDQQRTRYGGSEAVARTPTQADPRSVVAQSRLEEDPALSPCGAATPSPPTSARSASARTCSRTKYSPSGSR
ncbi:hypothetical protein [Corallococcus carmarthensis]|uniref:hypothetical protein n=1 Tax=Corallococcus carmarthensis TaxID=2316728 RepID=UPI003F657D48